MPVPGFGAGVPNARLTDRGGIVGLTSEYPYLDLNNTQDHPQLLARSWKAAVLINRIIMGLLNETRENARMNKEYSVNDYMVRHGGRIGNIDPHRIAFSAFGAANIDEDIWDPGLPAPLTDFTNRFTSNFTGSMDYFDAGKSPSAPVLETSGELREHETFLLQVMVESSP